MRRRGFLLNSAVLVLLIPMLLLLATYEDVSSQIIRAQSERTQIERTFNAVTFLDLEFEKALSLSGKRAVVSAVDYVAVTGRFINPGYKANNTLRDLILTGNSPSVLAYDVSRVMAGQTMETWLLNITSALASQGYTLSPSKDDILNSLELTVAPLDAFTIVVKGRIPNVTIADVSGRVVYTGPIPSSGDYVYSTVDLRQLEDPIFSATTGGRYQRSLRACEYSFPEIAPPFKVLSGVGSSSVSHHVGILSPRAENGKIFFGDTYVEGADAYVLKNASLDVTTNPIVVNTTVNGVIVNPTNMFSEGDMGVLVFGNAPSGAGGTWCSALGYRLNLTVTNNVGRDLNDYQIPLLISSSKGVSSQILSFLFQNTQNDGNSDIFRNGASVSIYDENCNPVPFWIEYWDPANRKALIWIRDTIPNGGQKTYSLYFGDGTPTKGSGDDVFIFFDDFEDGVWNDKWVQVVGQVPTESNGELTISGGNNVEAIRTRDLDYDGSYAVRFRMRGTSASINKDWDSGIEVEDSTDSNPNSYWVVRFVDDTKDTGNTLVVDEGNWWGQDRTTVSIKKVGKPTDYHVYEAYMRDTGAWYDSNTKRYDAKFRDITDGRVNYDNRDRLIDPPSLRYLYLVNYNDNSGNKGVYDFVFIRKYPDNNGEALEDATDFSGILISASAVDEKPVTSLQPDVARAYDIQPLIDCLLDQRYFGITDGWSFFERLEGSDQNHDAYVALAHAMQDEMNYKYGDEYYPIGLVSFMIPHANYDSKLLNLMLTLGLTVTDVSSADYYFLKYYFLDYYVGSGSKVTGYKVWGISYGTYSLGNLDGVPFYLDEDTALALLGEQGANDLLKR